MKRLMCVVLAFALMLLSGCSGITPENRNDKITVAASFYPVYIFTLNLLNEIDEVDVQCMAEQSVGCLHDYTLTAKDAKLLSDARVLVINGGGMESFLDDAPRSVGSFNVIDSSVGIVSVCHDDHHEHEDHPHENSHIWLSPDKAKKQILNIKKGLIKELPEYEKQIEDNYADYIKRLESLEKEQGTVILSAKDLKTISFHGAFEYLAKDLGFEICHTIESDEGYEPSAKVLASLSSEIEKENIRALFIAPDYEGSAAEILKGETNIEIYTLNPIISGEKKLTAYEDAMKSNYKMILEAVK